MYEWLSSPRAAGFNLSHLREKVESAIPKGFCASPGPGIQFVMYTIKHIIPDSKRFLYTLRPGIQFYTYMKKGRASDFK